jgi:hypothetical protein
VFLRLTVDGLSFVEESLAGTLLSTTTKGLFNSPPAPQCEKFVGSGLTTSAHEHRDVGAPPPRGSTGWLIVLLAMPAIAAAVGWLVGVAMR